MNGYLLFAQTVTLMWKDETTNVLHELYNIETISLKEIQANQRNAQQVVTDISHNFPFETFIIIRKLCVI
jgi:hypothetical protein